MDNNEMVVNAALDRWATGDDKTTIGWMLESTDTDGLGMTQEAVDRWWGIYGGAVDYMYNNLTRAGIAFLKVFPPKGYDPNDQFH